MAFTLNRSYSEFIFKRVLPGMLFVKCHDRYDNRSGNAVRWQQKLIKAEGLFLVNPARVSIRDSQVVAPFSCLSFITEFVVDSFDAASSFLVLKMGSGALGIFRGIFLGPGGWSGWFLRGFGGPGSSGRVVWGDKPKTRHFSGSLGCVGRQHP